MDELLRNHGIYGVVIAGMAAAIVKLYVDLRTASQEVKTVNQARVDDLKEIEKSRSEKDKETAFMVKQIYNKLESEKRGS